MDYSKRGGFKRSFLLLLSLYLTSQQRLFVEGALDDEYSELSKNQEQFDDSSDPRTKFVSSLSHLLEQDEEDKRSSSFFPLRGKKSPSDETYQFLNDLKDKKSQFYPLRGKKIPFDLKRASYFMPMRGRKSDEADDFSEERESEEKRASSFMPMRGKKSIYQQLGKSGTYNKDITLPHSSGSNRSEVQHEFGFGETQVGQLRNKRVISFTPMRGRRLLSETNENTEGEFPEHIVTTLLDKKAYSFMPMRGRRISVDDVLRNSNDGNESDVFGKNYTDVMQDFKNLDYKRASSFMPMRGRRRQYFDPLQSDIAEDKRKMSFMPMRGRKNFDDDIDGEKVSYSMPNTLKTIDNLDNESKRASSFMPMRGRRTSEIIDDEDKRVSHFMPMRGRRTSEIADEDKRASSFMPMRGRRTSDITDDVSLEDKRASSFMPMRGRRSVTNFDLDTQDHLIKRYSHMEKSNRRLQNKISNGSKTRRKRSPNISEDFYLDSEENLEKRGYAFMPMRGRRMFPKMDQSNYYYHAYPFFTPPGIGSALTFRSSSNRDAFVKAIRAVAAASRNRRQYDWESVKRGFHATRGKRLPNGYLESDPDGDQIDDDFKTDLLNVRCLFSPQEEKDSTTA